MLNCGGGEGGLYEVVVLLPSPYLHTPIIELAIDVWADRGDGREGEKKE